MNSSWFCCYLILREIELLHVVVHFLFCAEYCLLINYVVLIDNLHHLKKYSPQQGWSRCLRPEGIYRLRVCCGLRYHCLHSFWPAC